MLPSVERFSHSFVTSSAILTSLFAAITVVTYGCGSIATAPESDEASIAAASEASDLNSIFTSFSAAEYVEEFGIFKAAVAKKAIPYCNITFIKSNEMKTRINQYLTILYESNPSSVGGSMPDDNFYAE